MISIVIPVLDEAENIKSLIPAICEELPEREIILMDGCSTDDTVDVVDTLKKRYEGIQLLQQTGHGYANALIEGLTKATGDIIVTMDAENHIPLEIHKLLGALKKENADVVVGSRFLKGSDVELERRRFLSTRIANKLAKAALRLNVKDCSSGFRVYKAETIKRVIGNMRTEYFSVQVELLDRIRDANGKIVEVPIRYLRRERGNSKFKFGLAVKDATTLLKIARDERVREVKSQMRGARR